MTEKEKLSAPGEETVLEIVRKFIPGASAASRAPEGVSTYVYRIVSPGGVHYARFLPEDATFGVEVTAQRILGGMGVPVPEVAAYVPKEPVTGHSFMLTQELPGRSIEADPPENRAEILRQAGRALAKLHTVPVDGFGWIDRDSEERLRAPLPDYRAFAMEFLAEDAAAYRAVSPGDADAVSLLALKAAEALDAKNAVLVHGDFCPEHIFHRGGRFTGFIDFGEIRGCHPFFDLGCFLQSDETPGQAATQELLAGYGEVRPLSPADRRAVKLSALAFCLRFVGKKQGLPAQSHWVERVKAMKALLM